MRRLCYTKFNHLGVFQESSNLTAAVIGIHDKYSSNDIELPGSGTANTANLFSLTNMGTHGMHIFRIDQEKIEGLL